MAGICRAADADKVPIEEFFPAVLAALPTAPEELIEPAVRTTIVDFCKTTHTLRRLFYADVYKGVENYWFDSAAAGRYYRRYKDAINRAKVRVFKKHQAGPIIARAAKPWF